MKIAVPSITPTSTSACNPSRRCLRTLGLTPSLETKPYLASTAAPHANSQSYSVYIPSHGMNNLLLSQQTLPRDVTVSIVRQINSPPPLRTREPLHNENNNIMTEITELYSTVFSLAPSLR